jgi:hypothetical protein
MLPNPAVQFTPVLLLPLTDALNRTVLRGCTTAFPGVTLTFTEAGEEIDGFTVTVANALESKRAALLAVTVT